VQASASITTQNQQLQQCNARNIEEQPGAGESMLSLPSGIVEGTNNSQKLISHKSSTVSSAHRINYLATFNGPTNTVNILGEPMASGGLSCMPATETNVPLAKEPKPKLLTPPPTSAIKKEASVTRGTLPSGSSKRFKQEIIEIGSSPSPPRRMIKREVVELEYFPSPPGKRYRSCPKVKVEKLELNEVEIQNLEEEKKKIEAQIEEAQYLANLKKQRDAINAKLEAVRSQQRYH